MAAGRETALDATPLEQEVTALFDEWRRPLLGYISTLRLSLQDGEEVVQDVFLALFEHLREGRPRDNLRGWLFRVGHNLALKKRSRAARQCNDGSESDLQSMRDQSPNPEQALAIKQRQTRLLAVVAALPEQDRCCLHLRAEGLRYREIAEVLGISLGGVALCLGRALERLQNIDR